MRNFQKCLVRMLETKGQAVVFFEQHFAPSRLLAGALSGISDDGKVSMAIECVPLTLRDHRAAPSYFRKAILEAGEEWSQHRKLYDTNGKVSCKSPCSVNLGDVKLVS